MKTTVALCLIVLCAVALVPLLHSNAQVADSRTVSIEAMCSADSAGVRWKVTHRDAYVLVVRFSCTLSSDNELTDDKCFKKEGKAFLVAQWREPYKTHIIGTKLENGTACTFHATTYTLFDRQLDSVSASCIVNDSAPSLPAHCRVPSDTQKCVCSCNPGFTVARPNPHLECEDMIGTESTTSPLNQTETESIPTTPSPFKTQTETESTTEVPLTTKLTTNPAIAVTTEYSAPSYKDSRTVSIEAMCSADSAGVRWNVTHRDAYVLVVRFSCTSSSKDELTNDKCFKKEGKAFLVAQWREPYKTHIIGTMLEKGTVCTFHATTYNVYDRQLDSISASCTVNDSAPSLPAHCSVLSDTQKCECSCNPGFTATRPNPHLECEQTAPSSTTDGQVAP